MLCNSGNAVVTDDTAPALEERPPRGAVGSWAAMAQELINTISIALY
ncbi:hypothetical protein VIB_002129 [Vibrio metschnikovii CIP 69.14]|nr:hypothetical protein VIB_002129 [Vibrio metschnikovii CIP 69.14]